VRSSPTVLALAFAVALAGGAGARAQSSRESAANPNLTAADLAGTWMGSQCESDPNSPLSRQRLFVFTETAWKVLVQMFGDRTCNPSALLFTADFGGEYALGANSAAVPGAREARFGFSHKEVTPTAGGIEFLRLRCAQYDWTAEAAQDVSRGCALFRPVAACPVEYDLTEITGGMLRLGDRSHPLCTPAARPTRLQENGFFARQ